MRKQYSYLLIFAFLFLASCKGEKEKYLTQTWKLDNMEYLTPIPPEMEPAVQEIIAQQKASYSLAYNPDGTYEASMGTDKLKGTWKLNWNGSKITVTGADGVAKTYNITELSLERYSFKMRVPAAEKGGSEQELQFFMVPKK
ncbi:MAG: lipocalin family protein [Bacteroidetes bacterium]|nr:lipocalin family protein [Bacteroidota bacterium]